MTPHDGNSFISLLRFSSNLVNLPKILGEKEVVYTFETLYILIVIIRRGHYEELVFVPLMRTSTYLLSDIVIRCPRLAPGNYTHGQDRYRIRTVDDTTMGHGF